MRAVSRFPRQLEQPDLLGEPDTLDLDGIITQNLPQSQVSEPRSRRAMEDQETKLRVHFAGYPEIFFWHALAISYLRRRTPHNDKARKLFFRLWDEKGEWLSANLNSRWLVSALQTFADHGRTHKERACGSAGFLYGNLIKVYETEIASAYNRSLEELPFKAGKVPGLHNFQPGDDILANINGFVLAQALEGGVAGLALTRLIANIRDGETIFSRTDRLAMRRAERYLSFGGVRATTDADIVSSASKAP